MADKIDDAKTQPMEGDGFVSSDSGLLDLIRKRPMTVNELADALGVTATAVRQRLNRLMGQQFVQREAARAGRGRPSHQYRLTASGRRKTGSNFADLAMALWDEVRSIADPQIRRGLLQRISSRLAQQYSTLISGDSLQERMESLVELFHQRRIPFEVNRSSGQLVLTALACPYPELAEQDRGICAMERMLISEMMGEEIRLTQCRLDGAACCNFEPGTVQIGQG